MGEETKVQWAHHTFGWRGCSEATFPDGTPHPGCDHCYARDGYGKRFGVKWGPAAKGGTREGPAESSWKNPLAWARAAARAGERRRVFMSLGDPLDLDVPPEWRARLMDTIRQTACVVDGESRAYSADDVASIGYGMSIDKMAGLDWLLLTKRPENGRLVPEDVRPLVWLGTSVSDQRTADEWVPRLLAAEGFRLRFLSVEPLVGPVDLSHALGDRFCMKCKRGVLWDDCKDAPETDRAGWIDPECMMACPHCGGETDSRYEDERIDWVIVGGESGPKARPCHVEWVRSIVRQCREAQVPCFVKQLGARPVGLGGHGDFAANMDPKGGNMDQWPEDLRVRELPEVAS